MLPKALRLRAHVCQLALVILERSVEYRRDMFAVDVAIEICLRDEVRSEKKLVWISLAELEHLVANCLELLDRQIARRVDKLLRPSHRFARPTLRQFLRFFECFAVFVAVLLAALRRTHVLLLPAHQLLEERVAVS